MGHGPHQWPCPEVDVGGLLNLERSHAREQFLNPLPPPMPNPGYVTAAPLRFHDRGLPGEEHPCGPGVRMSAYGNQLAGQAVSGGKPVGGLTVKSTQCPDK